jgi:hypothetical protein
MKEKAFRGYKHPWLNRGDSPIYKFAGQYTMVH